MKEKVAIGGRESDLFDVLVGVKRGCLAPVIFNLFIVAVTLHYIILALTTMHHVYNI